MPNGKGYDLRGFLAGLVDWVGVELPTSEAIAGKRTLGQGHAHIKTITETGGAILGYRPLDVDRIQPGLFLSQSSPGSDCFLQRGFERLRRATRREQQELDVFSTWGYLSIQVWAEKHFRPPPTAQALLDKLLAGAEGSGNRNSAKNVSSRLKKALLAKRAAR